MAEIDTTPIFHLTYFSKIENSPGRDSRRLKNHKAFKAEHLKEIFELNCFIVHHVYARSTDY